MCFLQVLALACVASFIRPSSFIWSMRLACRVFFASLNMHWSFLFSSLLVVRPSHAYVIMGMMMASSICHVACIFIPLNCLFPLSASILSVAPLTFFSISATLGWMALKTPTSETPGFGGHVTTLTLQYLWPRPPGVWLGGPGCKPGHSGWSYNGLPPLK